MTSGAHKPANLRSKNGANKDDVRFRRALTKAMSARAKYLGRRLLPHECQQLKLAVKHQCHISRNDGTFSRNKKTTTEHNSVGIEVLHNAISRLREEVSDLRASIEDSSALRQCKISSQPVHNHQVREVPIFRKDNDEPMTSFLRDVNNSYDKLGFTDSRNVDFPRDDYVYLPYPAMVNGSRGYYPVDRLTYIEGQLPCPRSESRCCKTCESKRVDYLLLHSPQLHDLFPTMHLDEHIWRCYCASQQGC